MMEKALEEAQEEDEEALFESLLKPTEKKMDKYDQTTNNFALLKFLNRNWTIHNQILVSLKKIAESIAMRSSGRRAKQL